MTRETIQTGAPFSWKPTAFSEKCDGNQRERPTLHGKIIHINREHCHFTAEARVNGHAIRESFRYIPGDKAILRAR